MTTIEKMIRHVNVRHLLVEKNHVILEKQTAKKKLLNIIR